MVPPDFTETDNKEDRRGVESIYSHEVQIV